MQTEKSQPEGKRIMPETRLTELSALSIDPRVGIYWSAWRPKFNYFSYLKYEIQNCHIVSAIAFIFDILRRITTFSERHSVVCCWCKNDVTSEIQSSDVTFNVACELSQPMGKTELLR